MEIRPEANAIISIFPELTWSFSRGQVSEMIEALSGYDVKEWDPYPVNAIATGLIYAASQPESPDGEVSQAFLNYLTDTTPEALPDRWRAPLLEAVDCAGEIYFAAAQRDFDVQDIAPGAINLFRGVNIRLSRSRLESSISAELSQL